MGHLRSAVTDDEFRLLELRQSQGMTFKQIAEEMGYRYPQQAQAKFYRILQKLRAWHWMEKNDPSLISAAKAYSWNPDKLLRLYSILKKNGILTNYRDYSQKELLDFDGIGIVYADFLTAVK